MEKIRSVCKFITVEGDFAEIYHYETVQDKLMKLLVGRKKAIVLINAKAHVGFDLTQVQMAADDKNKRITLSHFPQPQLMSMETDLKYYDKKDGWLNPFTSSDLTEINREAKQHIIDKLPSSGLYEQAKVEALHTIAIMKSVIETVGWTLDYSALELPSGAMDRLPVNKD